MAWLYFVICAFDFIIAPSYIGIFTGQVWAPISLTSGGTLHFAFGAIITATSYSRGKEKIEEYRSAAGMRAQNQQRHFPQEVGYEDHDQFDNR